MVRTLVLILLSASVASATNIEEVPSQTPDLEHEFVKKSKYEAGLALGGFYLPDYPGADESRARFLGLPFVFYRGEIFRADREGGVRGRLINQDKTEFDFSVQAAFPTNSEDNEAREGMGDLDWIGEIGPRFVYHFYKSSNFDMDLKVPIRYAISTDLKDWDERGFTFNPLVQIKYNFDFDEELYLTGKLGATWATKKLMDYFYEVDASEATADRPEYNAQSGYMASTASLSLLKTIPEQDIVMFAGFSWNVYEGAANRNSPLLRDKYTESYSVGIAWTFYKSEEKEN